MTAASATLVGLVRSVALARGVIDHPTHRSSHDVPTPRGGGLGAVIVIVLMSAMVSALTGDLRLLLCIIMGATVAGVGWKDDRQGLPVRTRLTVHVLAGLAVGVLAVRGAPSLLLAVGLFAWWTFWTVSSINLVNFMDGINGLVASQVAIFAASLMAFGGGSASAIWYPAALCAACVGFLPWNFPRARIFLGDVGSGTLGFFVSLVGLQLMLTRGVDVVQVFLPLAPLYLDASGTIARRLWRREPVTQAHRSHLYQRLANGGWGHAPVTLLYLLASLAGAAIAHLAEDRARLEWSGVYVVGIAALGLLLGRSVPPTSTTSTVDQSEKQRGVTHSGTT